MKKIHIDIETRSTIDLKKSGTHAYAEKAELLICCWAIDDGEINTWTINSAGTPEIPMGDDYIYCAHNSQFEQLLLAKTVGISIPTERWDCTATRARMMNLPASLDGASKVLGLSETKDKRGMALIRKFCIPNKKGKFTLTEGEEFDEFIHYCRQDVVVERELDKVLYPIQECDRQYWYDDQRINDKGIEIDHELVAGALAIDGEHRDESMAILKELTELANPNSPMQMKGWLNEQGLKLPNMTADTIATIDTAKLTPTVATVVKLRQQLAQTASKKFKAIVASLCEDGRVRGVLQYYGASQSGRWAGRRVQPQNLPRGIMKVTKDLRDAVKTGSLDWLRTLYGNNVQGLLGTAVRASLIPPVSKSMIVSDYSQIECRVLAWLAGEEWALEEFRGDAMIYEATAAQMYGVDKHNVTKDQRQNGKGATLGCIAEGELVLTDIGLVPIENVTCSMLLWDGVEFVKHEGLLFKGYQEVIEYDGLRATRDHIVFTASGECEFQTAAQSGEHLLQSGSGGEAIRVGDSDKPRTKIQKRLEWWICADTVPRVWRDTLDKLQQYIHREVKRLSELLNPFSSTQVAYEASGNDVSTLRQSQKQGVQELRSQRNKVYVPNCTRGNYMDYGKSRRTQGVDNRQDQQQWSLRGRQPEVRNAQGTSAQQKNLQAHKRRSLLGARGESLRFQNHYKEDARGSQSRGNSSTSAYSCPRKEKELENNSAKVKVYDLLNAGSRHRFTVSGKLVHNCGYGGGAAAVENFGVGSDIAKKVVEDWRDANQKIVRYWGKCMAAAKRGGIVDSSLPPVHYRQTRFGLECKLPSGRVLYYPNAKFDGENFVVGKKKIWGGLMVENICQAVARDLLAFAVSNCERAGLDVRFHVHDEIIIYGEEGDLARLETVMCQLPEWAVGLPIDADGYTTTECYRK